MKSGVANMRLKLNTCSDHNLHAIWLAFVLDTYTPYRERTQPDSVDTPVNQSIIGLDDDGVIETSESSVRVFQTTVFAMDNHTNELDVSWESSNVPKRAVFYGGILGLFVHLARVPRLEVIPCL
jgi:hypothetical protein